MQSKQMKVNDEHATEDGVLNILPQADSAAPQEEPKAPAEAPVGESKPEQADESEGPITEAEKPYTVDQDKVAAKIEADKKFAQSLEERTPLPSTGDPNARVADPYTVNVAPRYNIVQNQSDTFLIVPDMKTSDEDMGLTFQPGEVIVLTDFYSPQQINRSKGLRYAATKVKGVGDNPMLVPLASEEEGAAFVPPQKKKYPKGTVIEDQAHNDFDDRFAELEQREAKREEKLLKKTLASRRLKKHGQAPARV